MFEIGQIYRQDFSDGDAVTFQPIKRHKNGNWYGIATDIYNGRKRKPRKVTVFNQPVPVMWKKVS